MFSRFGNCCICGSAFVLLDQVINVGLSLNVLSVRHDLGSKRRLGLLYKGVKRLDLFKAVLSTIYSEKSI